MIRNVGLRLSDRRCLGLSVLECDVVMMDDRYWAVGGEIEHLGIERSKSRIRIRNRRSRKRRRRRRRRTRRRRRKRRRNRGKEEGGEE